MPDAKRATGRVAMSVAIAIATACTTTPPSPGLPDEGRTLALAPYASGEACVELAAGDRLDYRWKTTAAVDFDLRYRDGNAIVSPLVLSQSRGDARIFEARLAERYCLHWQAGAVAATIDYRLAVRKPRA